VKKITSAEISRGSFDSLTVERLLEFAGECRARIRPLSEG
jgi:hypothetical protein